MDSIETLKSALGELRGVVAGLSEADMDQPTNCEPWNVRQLTSHAISSQLLWVGSLTKQELISVKDVMSATVHEGDLLAKLDETIGLAHEAWDTEGVLEAVHATAFGELPGSAVIGFPTIDAAAHAYDIATSVGRPIDFDADAIEGLTAVVEASCNDGTRNMGLFAEAAEPPADATATERLMAAAGRVIAR